MANITGQGRPTRTLKANKGDIYTDANTGIKYECLGPDGFVDVEGVNEPEYYDWKEIKSASGGGGVSSWNDLTDKPFGEEFVTRHTFIEGQQITFNPQGMTETEYLYSYVDNFTISATEGDKIIFVVDGQEYKCLVEKFPSGNLYSGNVLIGNSFGIETTLYPDCPILCTFSPGGAVSLYREADASEQIVLSMYVEKTSVSKLDEMYIPETIARKEDL